MTPVPPSVEALPPTVAQIESENPDLNFELAPIPTKDGSPVTLGVADHLMAFKNDGDKQVPDNKLSVIDLKASPPAVIATLETGASPAGRT